MEGFGRGEVEGVASGGFRFCEKTKSGFTLALWTQSGLPRLQFKLLSVGHEVLGKIDKALKETIPRIVFGNMVDLFVFIPVYFFGSHEDAFRYIGKKVYFRDMKKNVAKSFFIWQSVRRKVKYA